MDYNSILISYCLERIAKALKSRAMVPISNAERISMGPLVVPVAPKKKIILSSAAPKMAHATINARGCCKYLFMRLFLLSVGGTEVFVLCSIHHAVEIVNEKCLPT